MNKKLLLVPMVLLSLLSCSKETIDQTDQKGYDVTFNVNSLDVTVGDITPQTQTRTLTRAETALSDKVHSLAYYIFDSDSKLYATGTSSFVPGTDPVPEGFGSFKIKLAAGTYHALFIGLGNGKGYCHFINEDKQFNSNTYIDMKDQEMYYYCSDITINQNTNSYSVDLPRISAMLQVNITDDVTSDVGSVTISVDQQNKWKCAMGEKDYKENVSYTYDAILGSSKMETFSCYVFAPQTNNVTITVYDKQKAVLLTKTLQVQFYRNRKTIISGKLFGSIGARDMTVTVSDQWGDDNNVDL
jgi:hypothetical protein